MLAQIIDQIIADGISTDKFLIARHHMISRVRYRNNRMHSFLQQQPHFLHWRIFAISRLLSADELPQARLQLCQAFFGGRFAKEPAHVPVKKLSLLFVPMKDNSIWVWASIPLGNT
jgi:hypothetical protein